MFPYRHLISLLCIGFIIRCGLWIGKRTIQKKDPAQAGVLGVMMLVIACMIAGARNPSLFHAPSLSWILSSHLFRYASALVIPILFSVACSRMPSIFSKRLLGTLGTLCLLIYAVLPFMAPLLQYPQFVGMDTQAGSDGNCMQTTSYTCGPAAAVTLLRHLGVDETEGNLAIAANCNAITGTTEGDLARALTRLHGISSRIVYSKNPEDLKGTYGALAVVDYNTFVHHWVAILDYTDEQITYGDPLVGIVTSTPEAFDKRWKHIGIRILK